MSRGHDIERKENKTEDRVCRFVVAWLLNISTKNDSRVEGTPRNLKLVTWLLKNNKNSVASWRWLASLQPVVTARTLQRDSCRNDFYTTNEQQCIVIGTRGHVRYIRRRWCTDEERVCVRVLHKLMNKISSLMSLRDEMPLFILRLLSTDCMLSVRMLASLCHVFSIGYYSVGFRFLYGTSLPPPSPSLLAWTHSLPLIKWTKWNVPARYESSSTNKDELDLASIYLLTVQLRTNNHHIHVDKFIQLSVAIVQLR